jgi:hypothetical protein
MIGTGSDSVQRPVASSCEQANIQSSSIKTWEFLKQELSPLELIKHVVGPYDRILEGVVLQRTT